MQLNSGADHFANDLQNGLHPSASASTTDRPVHEINRSDLLQTHATQCEFGNEKLIKARAASEENGSQTSFEKKKKI